MENTALRIEISEKKFSLHNNTKKQDNNKETEKE